MLLEFRVRNFRSFRDESALSLVASKDRSLRETNVVATGITAIPEAVRSGVIYGANAGGKSNLMRALQLMRGIVVESAALHPSQQFNVQPFRLDENSLKEPTLFEATIAIDGVRYQYGFEFSATRIHAEWLLVYQKAKAQRWFDRRSGGENEKDKFEFGTHLTGPKRIWQDATRPNALFLSTAVQLNSESLSPLYRWFSENLIVFLEGAMLSPDFSTKMVQSGEAGAKRIASFLSAADIAITSISTQTVKGRRGSFRFDLATGKTDAETEESDITVPRFRHSGTIAADFDLPDESQGTQKLYALAAPMFSALENGWVLAIDELDRSFHPLLVRQIIEIFQNPKLNPRGSQLLFTTHDTSQLDATLLRRDQIWFAEKGRNQSSELVPLTEFSPRKDEALERGYLSGRYGGIPILSNTLLGEGSVGER
jgi:hypothetical protein